MTGKTMIGILGTFGILCAAVGIGGDSLMQANVGWSGAFIVLCAALVIAWWTLLHLILTVEWGKGGDGRGPERPQAPTPPPSGRRLSLDYTTDTFAPADDLMLMAQAASVERHAVHVAQTVDELNVLLEMPSATNRT